MYVEAYVQLIYKRFQIEFGHPVQSASRYIWPDGTVGHPVYNGTFNEIRIILHHQYTFYTPCIALHHSWSNETLGLRKHSVFLRKSFFAHFDHYDGQEVEEC
uniref:Uncharacterized protein n=1 Tax=Romanomermis culicivorax TaxID=13658 RepID=A0A915HR72_ROMCU